MLSGRVQCHISCKRCPLKHGSERMVYLDAVLVQKPSGSARLLLPLLRQIDIAPSGVPIFGVPLRFAVTKQDQGVEAAFPPQGQAKGSRGGIAGSPASDKMVAVVDIGCTVIGVVAVDIAAGDKAM